MRKKNSEKTVFDFDSFRNDIINNKKFKTFKDKYGFKTREKLDIKLLELMRLDGKFYEYTPDKVIRALPVYETSEGFIKISIHEVEKIKSSLKCERLKFEELIFDSDSKITITVRAA